MKSASTLTDYFVFDGEKIEGYLIKFGYSDLMSRFFPASYATISPVRNVLGQYFPLTCQNCGKDILENLDVGPGYNVVFINKSFENHEGYEVVDMYWCCKGECNDKIEAKYTQTYDYVYSNHYEGWQDIFEFCTPYMYLYFNLTVMNQLRDDKHRYSDFAFEKLKDFIIAISQKVLRESSVRELTNASDSIFLMNSGL